MTLHADELPIGDDVVRRLVDRDLPQFRDLPLQRLRVSGSTNALYGLGEKYLVRLPRQAGGSSAIEIEARWTARLQPVLPVAVPTVVAVGEPGFGFPERWAVTEWLHGLHPATPEPPGPRAEALARDLARFVRALGAAEVPADAAADPTLRWYRGRPLREVDSMIRGCLDECRALPDLPLDLDACERIWRHAVELPDLPQGSSERWVHGDLLAENLLVRSGRLAAVLDFGALSIGDPCVDLVVAWEVLDGPARAALRDAVGVDDTTWLCGRGWALAIALMTFPYYWHTMPERCAARLAMAQQVLADHDVATNYRVPG